MMRRGSYSESGELMETIRVLYHHEEEGWWAESPDVEGWSAAGEDFSEVRNLAVEGIPLAIGRDAELEHYVPAGERVTA
jgi:predicted RNase H-like HicB family nuclease